MFSIPTKKRTLLILTAKVAKLWLVSLVSGRFPCIPKTTSLAKQESENTEILDICV